LQAGWNNNYLLTILKSWNAITLWFWMCPVFFVRYWL
jgi:hypothetical protein